VDRLGCRNHPQAETDPSVPTQRIGQTEVPQRLQQEEERLSPERIPESPEQEAREWGDAVLLREELPGRLEAASVSHAGRTDRLAAPAAEAGIEVLPGRRIIRWNLISFQRAHEHDPAAWTVRLVSGDRVGWACRQAESAVYAGIERCQIQSHESLPSSATERHPRGSNVSRSRPTSCPTPSRYAPK